MTYYNPCSLVVLILFLYIPLVVTAPDKTLRFNERGKFKIVQFTDLHYGDDEKENQLTSIVQGIELVIINFLFFFVKYLPIFNFAKIL
jgi:hypothetical protein